MRRFRIRRGLTVPQAALGVIVGVISGVYIWKPPLQKYFKEKKLKEAEESEAYLAKSAEKGTESGEVKQQTDSSPSG